MMANSTERNITSYTIEELQQQRAELLIRNYNRATQKWYNKAGEVASPEETAAYQDKARELKFGIQMIQEAEKVGLENQTNPHSDDYKKLMPLVSRREWPTLWSNLGKMLQDGKLFTFKPVETFLVCGCTDDRIYNEYEDQHPVSAEDINALRNQHNITLNATDGRPIICSTPIKQEVFQNKHTIGNWNCQACLNVGAPIATAEDANAATAMGIKSLEWCPRFLPLLRTRTISEYIQMVTAAHDNKLCYAGLLHTEMSFEEETFVDEKVEHGKETTSTKTYVVITKKCDTCIYLDVEKKEYHVPEQVADNDLLMKLPGDN